MSPPQKTPNSYQLAQFTCSKQVQRCTKLILSYPLFVVNFNLFDMNTIIDHSCRVSQSEKEKKSTESSIHRFPLFGANNSYPSNFISVVFLLSSQVSDMAIILSVFNFLVEYSLISVKFRWKLQLLKCVTESAFSSSTFLC